MLKRLSSFNSPLYYPTTDYCVTVIEDYCLTRGYCQLRLVKPDMDTVFIHRRYHCLCLPMEIPYSGVYGKRLTQRINGYPV